MLELIPIRTDHPYYPFVERLLESAFPPEERRNADRQRTTTDGNARFRCLVIQTELEQPIGLITCWDFADFLYIEHFAIDQKRRGYGYGREALQLMLEQTPLPVVLEVEMPQRANDTAHRRIGFYKRLGFRLRRAEYKQPPYRQGDGWLPMKLMTYGPFKKMDKAIKLIRREVYEAVR